MGEWALVIVFRFRLLQIRRGWRECLSKASPFCPADVNKIAASKVPAPQGPGRLDWEQGWGDADLMYL